LRARAGRLLRCEGTDASASRDQRRFLYRAGGVRHALPGRIGGTPISTCASSATTLGGVQAIHPLLRTTSTYPLSITGAQPPSALMHDRASSLGALTTLLRRTGISDPSRRLDYELELGIWIGAGNATRRSPSIREADSHVSGFLPAHAGLRATSSRRTDSALSLSRPRRPTARSIAQAAPRRPGERRILWPCQSRVVEADRHPASLSGMMACR